MMRSKSSMRVLLLRQDAAAENFGPICCYDRECQVVWSQAKGKTRRKQYYHSFKAMIPLYPCPQAMANH